MINVGGFKPMPKPEPRPKKAPTRIKQKSKKQQHEDSKYLKARVIFLEGKPCEKCKHTFADQVHHKKGRQGYADKWAKDRGISLLHDQRYWLAVCCECHAWIEKNPMQAIDQGWSKTRTNVLI